MASTVAPAVHDRSSAGVEEQAAGQFTTDAATMSAAVKGFDALAD